MHRSFSIMNAVEIGICILSFCFVSNVALASEWSYAGDDGPSEWSEDSPECAGEYQSPVDIVQTNVLVDSSLKKLEFTGYGQTLGGGTFVNNGHSIQLNFPTNKTFKISGGGMGDNTYTALQLHFHWAAPGSNDGSEHTINGLHAPVEMHIVHIKDPYTSTDQIKDMADGLAVIGVFLDVEKGENMAFGELLKVARHCTYKGMKAPLTVGPTLFSLLPDSGSFYRYSGSLTTPPCYQAVTWTVLKEPVMISEQQLEMLQSLRSATISEAAKNALNTKSCEGEDCQNVNKRSLDSPDDAEDNLGGNFRPTEPLNGRIVTLYSDLGFTALEREHHWTYDGHLTGTSQWSRTYPICAQDRQSPIDIDTSKLEIPQIDPSEGDIGLVFKGYEDKLKGTFVNNGHAVQLNFGDDLDYVITDGGLNSFYKALQLHFHWGEASSDGEIEGGSEHTMDNMRYPAEMHIVHGKTSELSNLSSPDSIVVLGVFVDVSNSDSRQDNDEGADADMQSLFNAISKVPFSGEKTEFPSGPGLESLLPKDKSFYRYYGSLTTPPCSETVIWTVFRQPIVISVNQFIAFQRLFSAEDSQMKHRNSIKIERGMELVEGISNIGKSTEEGDGSLPENTGKETPLGSSAEVDLSNTTSKHLLRNNYRPVQALNGRTVYYYALGDDQSTTAKPVDPAGLPVWEIVLFTVGGILVFVVCIVIVMRCCSKKNKNADYSAGRKGPDDAANL